MPLLWLSLAFLAGILLAANTSLPTWVWMLLAALSLSLGIIRSLFARLPYRFAQSVSQFIHRLPPLPVPLFLVFLALFLGAVRYQVAQPDLVDPGFIASFNDLEVKYIIEGVLVEPPDQRDAYTNLRLSTEEIRPIDNLLFTPVGGLLLARVPANGDWRYGDRLRLEGWLETPSENEEFSYRDYLARQGIHSYMGKVKANLVQRDQGNLILGGIYALKARALATVYRIYPDPEAALLAGILLGVETGIPEDVQQAFLDTGTSHIIVISGFNITILAALFAMIFGRLLGRWRGAMAALDRALTSTQPLQTFLVTLDQVGGYKEDPLRKKSLLLAMILNDRPETFLPLRDDEQIAPIIDYHFMRSCLRIGLIDVLDGELETKLTNRQIVSPVEEWAVRYPAYLAHEGVVMLSGKSLGAVNSFLFTNARKRCPEMTEPQCRLCPLDSVCAHRKELFQPVLRTSFY